MPGENFNFASAISPIMSPRFGKIWQTGFDPDSARRVYFEKFKPGHIVKLSEIVYELWEWSFVLESLFTDPISY